MMKISRTFLGLTLITSLNPLGTATTLRSATLIKAPIRGMLFITKTVTFQKSHTSLC